MPEGDTIFRTARTLHRALAGKEVLRFESHHSSLRALDLSGKRVVSARAKGKNVLLDFERLTLQTHLRMRGEWHIYRESDPWQRRRSDANIVIVTDPWTAVGFNIPTARWLRPRRTDGLVGPDLLDASVPDETFVDALLARPDPLGVALLDQRVLAGIGNVYKSELCFLARADPFARSSDVQERVVARLVEDARRLLRRNLHTRRRTTRPDSTHPLWVYGRRGELCFRCATAIEMQHQGDALRGQGRRSTYYCPLCQGVTPRP